MSKVITDLVRFNFIHIFEMASIAESTPTYNIQIMIPKSDKVQIKKIKAALDDAIEEGKISLWKNKIPSDLKKPIRDGDDKSDDYPEYEGMYLITAKSGYKPGIVDSNLEEIKNKDDIYNGCWGRVSLIFKPYSHKSGGNGITTFLMNVQKLKDDEKLSSGICTAKDDFSDGYGSNFTKVEEEDSLL